MHVLRTGFAAVLLAFVCSIGLVVQTAPPAAALAPIDLGKLGKDGVQLGAKIVGSEEAGLAVRGASLFGRFTPAGIAVTAGMVAWWAYDNRDAIMDFLTPGDSLAEYCARDVTCDPTKLPNGTGDPGWGPVGSDSGLKAEILGLASDPSMLTIRVTCTNVFVGHAEYGPSSCGFANYDNRAFGAWISSDSAKPADRAKGGTQCRRADGSIVQAQSYTDTVIHGVFGGVVPVGDARWTTTTDMRLCPSGQTVVGVAIPPLALAPSYQQFGLAWGTLYTPPSTVGDGPVTFDEADVTVRCKNAVTGETQELHSTSNLADAATVVLPSCKQHLGDDWYGTGVTIAPVKPSVDDEPIGDDETWDVPDFPPWEWDELIPNEDAQPCHGTKNGCSLTVWVDDDPCDVGIDKCKTWTKIDTRTPDRVKCVYGTRVIPTKNCYPLALAYTGTKVNTKTGTPKVPEAGPKTPTDGNPEVADPTADPTPDPPTDPADDGEQSKCFPHGWGVMNPFGWVYKPVKCVLVWAFVPDGDFGLDTLWQTFQTRPPGSLIVGLGDAATSALQGFNGGGCGTLGTIPLPGKDLSFSCPEITSMNGYGLVYSGFEALIYGSGMFAAFRMLTGAMRQGSDD